MHSSPAQKNIDDHTSAVPDPRAGFAGGYVAEWRGLPRASVERVEKSVNVDGDARAARGRSGCSAKRLYGVTKTWTHSSPAQKNIDDRASAVPVSRADLVRGYVAEWRGLPRASVERVEKCVNVDGDARAARGRSGRSARRPYGAHKKGDARLSTSPCT